MTYGTIKLDLNRNTDFTEQSLKLITEYYMHPEDRTPQDALARPALAFCGGDEALAQRIYTYASKKWFMYASPIISNAPPTEGKARGLPISCYLSDVPDSLPGLMEHTTETRWLAVNGGGVGGNWSKLRAISGIAPGPLPFLHTIDADMIAYSQGECYHPETEILTASGWKRIELVTLEDKVLQINPKGYSSFTYPTEVVCEPFEGELINFKNINRGLDLKVTPNHSMVISRKSKTLGWGELTKIRADKLSCHNEVKFVHTSQVTSPVTVLSSKQKLLIAFQADGFRQEGCSSMCFRFTKDRKILRLTNILEDLGVKFSINKGSDGVTAFTIPACTGSKTFSWVNLIDVSSGWGESFLQELQYWDGHRQKGNRGITYSSVIKSNVDVIQAIATLCGKKCRVTIRDRESPRQRLYSAYITDKKHLTLDKVISENFTYTGNVHCVVVPDGTLMVRNNGTTLVCGNTRRGSYAAYLDVSHPDIIQFISIRVPTGGSKDTKCFNLNNAVNISDEFIQAVKADTLWELKCPHTGEVHDTIMARELWETLLEIRYRTGEPYLFFIDTANADLPKPMQDKGLRINGSNLCVAPETLVLTKEYGHKAIVDMIDEEVQVWNGQQWSLTTIRQTSSASELIRIHFKHVDGERVSLDCTKEHTFYINAGTKVTAGDLVKGDKLEEFYLPDQTYHRGTIVTDIELTGRISPTYCFTEPLLNKGMFNGVLAGNCIEIMLPTDEERTAVCCLSSLNLEKYHEWKDTSIVEDLTTFLDNVLTYFIENAPDELSKARYSASQERSIGIGAMGFHSLLQNENIPWESQEARDLNTAIFKLIKDRAKVATETNAQFKGSCLDVVGVRNAHLLAIAPNANSGILCGTSASIEPIKSNAYTHRTRIGSHLIKNTALIKLLQELGRDTSSVWESIVGNSGSVQHLDFLTKYQKDVFKTAFELDQSWVVRHAGDRQKFVCQGQSVNLFFPRGANKGQLNRVHLLAHELGLKGLYYLRTTSAVKAESINKKLDRKALVDYEEEESCEACQG